MEMIKTYNGSLYFNSHNNYTFLEIYPESANFIADYKACEIPTTISEDNLKILYFTLVGRKGNDSILSNSIGQFKYQLFTLIWQYGPYWEKQLEIQGKLRGLTEAEILDGSTQQYNSAANTATPISQDAAKHTGTLSKAELPYVNSQEATLNTRSKVDGYGLFGNVLKTDVSQRFFNEFDKLFQFMSSPFVLLYCDENENT